MLADLATGLFAVAVYGALAFPLVLSLVAWRTTPGKRAQRSLAVTGGWVTFCVVAGVGRLPSDDGYYSPNHVTYWEHATADERRTIVVLLLAAGCAAVTVLTASRRERIRPGVALTLVGVAWLISGVMLAHSASLGLH